MDRRQSPAVDVIICARNEARRIASCIQSLIAQDYPEELVTIYVVDNGSSDGTTDIVRQFPVTLLEERKTGSAAARNRAFFEGSGDLVAFLDGHCVANTAWISAMASQFADLRVGGVQACINNTATDSRVLAYLTDSGMTSNDRVLEDTVQGKRNVYPWILSGNCMYRRSAVERVGGFDATLPACEDVDLAWKVVLSGYLLTYCGDASVVHYNDDDWGSFAKKSWRQGRGSAVLARRYLPHGAQNAFEPAMIWGNGRNRSLIALRYWAGYRYESAHMPGGKSSDADKPLPTIDESTRRPFAWTDTESLSISTDAVYWLPSSTTTTIVHSPSRSRIVLDETANFIFRRLASGSARDAIARDVVTSYGISETEAVKDVDEFVGELLQFEILRKAPRQG